MKQFTPTYTCYPWPFHLKAASPWVVQAGRDRGGGGILSVYFLIEL